MFNRRKKVIVIILPLATAMVVLSALALSSALAVGNCVPTSCAIIESGGEKYRLTGEAHKAYLDLENIALPLQKIKFDSEYIGDRPYLLNIDGATPAVEEIASKYNVRKNGTKVYGDNQWTSLYGWIYQDDLERFLSENDAHSLSSRSVTVSPVGSYQLEEGVVVHGIQPAIPDAEFIAEREVFGEAEKSKIVSQKNGVERLWLA